MMTVPVTIVLTFPGRRGYNPTSCNVTLFWSLPMSLKSGISRGTRLLESLGSGIADAVIAVFEEMGRVVLMFWQTVAQAVTPPFRYKELIRQLDFIGVQSLMLVLATGAFTGMVSALQAYEGFRRFGAQSLVGATVALGLARELGPVLCTLMVIGRTVSAITAELGSMRNTQQIDALWTMAVNPVHYLVVPRVMAMVLALPLLALFFEASGMVGAYVACVHYLGIDPGTFITGVHDYLDPEDIVHGVMKSVVFGLVISLVGCSEGYNARLGVRGVGLATTRAVVISSVLVLGIDYFMTALMLKPR